MNKQKGIPSIEPWLTVENGEEAVTFYKAAFGADETYRLDNPSGGLVVRLAVNETGFWISSESNEKSEDLTIVLGGNTVRMILIVDDPDVYFTQALKAGATEIFPVSEGHGWRVGRISDPFGLNWEIGHQL